MSNTFPEENFTPETFQRWIEAQAADAGISGVEFEANLLFLLRIAKPDNPAFESVESVRQWAVTEDARERLFLSVQVANFAAALQRMAFSLKTEYKDADKFIFPMLSNLVSALYGLQPADVVENHLLMARFPMLASRQSATMLEFDLLVQQMLQPEVMQQRMSELSRSILIEGHKFQPTDLRKILPLGDVLKNTTLISEEDVDELLSSLDNSEESNERIMKAISAFMSAHSLAMPLPGPEGEPTWVTELANSKPNAQLALGGLVGLYDGPQTDEELLDSLKEMDHPVGVGGAAR